MRCRRDNRLLEKRNAKIAARYYYWTEIQRYRSDDAIRQLSEEEFFLSEATSIRIIQRCNLNDAQLRKIMRPGVIRARKPKAIPEELQRLFSFMPDTMEE